MNLVIIVLDSLRQDHVGCYGNDQIHTPNIDRLAAESAVFTRCWSESLPTIPARRAMHTGARTFPFDERPRPKGVYNRHKGWLPLPEEQVTLAEHLQPMGYITALIADTYHIFKPGMNFHRSFNCFEWIRGQEFDQWRSGPISDAHLQRHAHPKRPPSRSLRQYLQNQSKRITEEDYQSPRVFQAAMEWLEDNAEHEKFLLWVESFDPHEPWEAPRRYVDLYDIGYRGKQYIDPRGIRRSELSDEEFRHVRALYAAEVTMVDHWVGQFLDKLDEVDRREDTIVLLLADHGKIIGEFDAFGMSEKQTSPALYAVPCMIRHPSAEGAGGRIDAWAYNIDAMATVVNLLGVPPLPQAEGIDLWPLVTDGAPAPRDHLVCAYNTVECVWQDSWLYVNKTEEGVEELYDLSSDPGQTSNVANEHGELRQELAEKLRAIVAGGHATGDP